MNVHYPVGQCPSPSTRPLHHIVKKNKNAANRGMGFEADINATNAYYLEKDLCVVYKRPTPINVVKVDYSKGARITQAYFEAQSTTDYNGVYEGHYLDFEAKSSRSKTSFPLNNIAPQQVDHLRAVDRHGGITFFLICLYSYDEVYAVKADLICDFYEKKPRKSIPISFLREKGHLVKEGIRPRYDYLAIVKEFFLK